MQDLHSGGPAKPMIWEYFMVPLRGERRGERRTDAGADPSSNGKASKRRKFTSPGSWNATPTMRVFHQADGTISTKQKKGGAKESLSAAKHDMVSRCGKPRVIAARNVRVYRSFNALER